MQCEYRDDVVVMISTVGFTFVSLCLVSGRVSAEEAKSELVPQSDDGPGVVNHPPAGSGLQTPEPC